MVQSEKVRSGCKGCGPQYEVTEAQIDRILQAPMFKDPAIVVPDAIYNERLQQCADCEHLHQQQTCVLCGCFVRVSAAYRSKSCPDLKNRRWNPYTN